MFGLSCLASKPGERSGLKPAATDADNLETIDLVLDSVLCAFYLVLKELGAPSSLTVARVDLGPVAQLVRAHA
jgi:hypothetical protein